MEKHLNQQIGLLRELNQTHMAEVIDCALPYLMDCYKSTTDVVSHQQLGSASRHQFIVPRHSRTKFGRRAFSVAGLTAWNSLPDYLRNQLLSEYTLSDC